MHSYTGGHNTELSQEAALLEINAVLWERLQREDNPAYVRATDGFFFNQGETVGKGFIWDEDSNVGEFEETAEQEDITITDTFIGNQTTVLSQKWTKRIPISDEVFRADMVGKREKLGMQVADRARQTQDKQALLKTYADAFDGSEHTTPDGQALASNLHTTLKGSTVDNLETGSLTPDNLWTANNSLADQLAQDGDLGSYLFEGLLVPFTLYKTAKEVTASQLIANSAENNLNIFDTEYGNLRIGASAFLNSGQNGATNANTSYHVMSSNHMIERKVFYGVTTSMTPPEYTANDNYVLTAKFHEVAFPGSWSGGVHANGSV